MNLTTLLLCAFAANLVQCVPRRHQEEHRSGTQEITLYTPSYSMPNPSSFLFYHQHANSRGIRSQPGQQQHNNGTHKFKCQTLGPQCARLPLGAPRHDSISVKVFCVGHRRGNSTYEMWPKVMSPCPRGSECRLEKSSISRPHKPFSSSLSSSSSSSTTTTTTTTTEIATTPTTPPEVAAVPDKDIWMWLEDENHNIPRGPHPTSGSWTEGLEGFMKKIPGTENDNPSVVTMPAHVLDRQRRVLWWPVFNLTCVEEKHN